LRRIIIIGTALAVLVTAGVALAASSFNSYTGSVTVAPGQAGAVSSPNPVGISEKYTAANTTPGWRAAPLKDIQTWIYGVVSDGKDFPKCSPARITANHTLWDKACPKGSLVGQGATNALLGPGGDATSVGTPCNPYLKAYNGGQGKLVFFFNEFGPYQCAGLSTGASAPWVARVYRTNGYLVIDSALPPDVSTQAGGLKGIYGSLILQQLAFPKMTKRVHGRRVAYNASIACKRGRRPYKYVFTAQNFSNLGSNAQTVTVSGSQRC
jgi:hypothetical protein